MRHLAKTLKTVAGGALALVVLLTGPVAAQEAATDNLAAYRWENTITDFDKSRLERLEEAIALGNEKARAAENVDYGDRVTLARVMDAEPVPVDDAAILGWWACRLIKVGGDLTGLVVYPYFDCRIKVVDGFLFFEKRSGSQRMSGRLYQRDTMSRVLLAAPTTGDAPQRPYVTDADENTDPQIQNEAGILQQLENGRMRVLFPFPALEATYTVMDLKRPDA
ncbi:DUF4893 domain-containing protein [Tepidicaulis sp. LMO-SS28]|uniref:DUF4893 domain-containing protein n=1 Tax=Tepidicaulis sp. LMO-SS28 TaxID=3447455 RepID=UPI003EE0EBDD